MASDKKKAAKKLAKQQKRELQREADNQSFRRSDSKNLRGAMNEAYGPKEPVETITETAKMSSPQTDTVTDTGKIVHETVKVASVEKPVSARSAAINRDFAGQSSFLLAIATGLAVLMAIAVWYFRSNTPSGISLNSVMLVLGTLFPLFLAAGLAMLAVSIQARGNRPIVRIILTTLMLYLFIDFAENALLYALSDQSGYGGVLRVLAVIKWAGPAFAAILLSSILPKNGGLGMLAHLILRYLFPISVALIIASMDSNASQIITGLGVIISLVVLSAYATSLSDEGQS
jgi:hypothetical protein